MITGRSVFSLLLAILGALAVQGTVRAGEIPIGPDLARSGWRHLNFSGLPETRFASPAPGLLSVEAKGSSSLIYRRVPDAYGRKTLLSWRWRVDKAVPSTDLTRKGSDDRSIALFVVFAPRNPGLADRLRAAAGMLPASGHVLSYVWGGAHRAGTVLRSPHLGDRGALIVMRPAADGPVGAWVAERVNVARDYRRAFGAPPPPVRFVAVSADSDDTRTHAKASIGSIRFLDGTAAR